MQPSLEPFDQFLEAPLDFSNADEMLHACFDGDVKEASREETIVLANQREACSHVLWAVQSILKDDYKIQQPSISDIARVESLFWRSPQLTKEQRAQVSVDFQEAKYHLVYSAACLYLQHITGERIQELFRVTHSYHKRNMLRTVATRVCDLLSMRVQEQLETQVMNVLLTQIDRRSEDNFIRIESQGLYKASGN